MEALRQARRGGGPPQARGQPCPLVMAAQAAPRPLRSRVHHSPFRTTVPLCCARIFTRVRWQRCGPPPKRPGRGGGRSHRATPPPIQARRTPWCPADAGVAQTKPGWVHDPTVTECTDYLPPTTRGLAHTTKRCSMRAVALFPVVLHGRGTLPPCRSAARPPPRRGGSVARAGCPPPRHCLRSPVLLGDGETSRGHGSRTARRRWEGPCRFPSTFQLPCAFRYPLAKTFHEAGTWCPLPLSLAIGTRLLLSWAFYRKGREQDKRHLAFPRRQAQDHGVIHWLFPCRRPHPPRPPRSRRNSRGGADAR